MGKRKKSSRTPQGPRKVRHTPPFHYPISTNANQREPLATTFSCLFCNHENSVVVKLDKKSGVGDLSCKVCGQKYQTGINYLSAAVDVYSDWVDACDSVAKGTANDYDGTVGSQPASNRQDAPGAGETYEDEDF
ncbi:Transcription elongation factor [Penicillium argentinense]|uniref:Transcription elongation factor 1 homolog n=1 Tax=Penicillium argentinense TaxID=1131581 RepID=A0A9W9K7B8_9EURO|nr:Transcription elongation factor [Penicillium argentinense]KAJ5095161.1 Transcription elongation factor [Penicillium argentinense]